MPIPIPPDFEEVLKTLPEEYLIALVKASFQANHQHIGVFCFRLIWDRFSPYVYGSSPPEDCPKGILGARLKTRFGEHASRLWDDARTQLEQMIFDPDNICRHVNNYDPQWQYLRFFLRWVNWRIADVLKALAKDPALINSIPLDPCLLVLDQDWVVGDLVRDRDIFKGWACMFVNSNCPNSHQQWAAFELKFRWRSFDELTEITQGIISKLPTAANIQKTINQQATRARQIIADFYQRVADIDQKVTQAHRKDNPSTPVLGCYLLGAAPVRSGGDRAAPA